MKLAISHRVFFLVAGSIYAFLLWEEYFGRKAGFHTKHFFLTIYSWVLLIYLAVFGLCSLVIRYRVGQWRPGSAYRWALGIVVVTAVSLLVWHH